MSALCELVSEEDLRSSEGFHAIFTGRSSEVFSRLSRRHEAIFNEKKIHFEICKDLIKKIKRGMANNGDCAIKNNTMINGRDDQRPLGQRPSYSINNATGRFIGMSI